MIVFIYVRFAILALNFIQEFQIIRSFPVRGFFLFFDLWFEILDAFFNLVRRSDFFYTFGGKVFVSPSSISSSCFRDRSQYIFSRLQKPSNATNRDPSPFYDCSLSILLQNRWLQSTDALKRLSCPHDYSSLKTVAVSLVESLPARLL